MDGETVHFTPLLARRELEAEKKPAARVLLLGLDGAAYDVLVPLAESGVMPNLARLMQSAALVRTAGVDPCCESVAWSTLETGGGPELHGLLDDGYLDHRSRRIVLAAARRAACPTLAALVTAADPQAPAVAPADLRSCAPIWDRKPSSLQEVAQGIARIEVLLRRWLARARHADASTDWRLMTLRIDVLDALQHHLWHLLGIGDAPGGSRSWSAKAREAFSLLDRWLGDLLELAERRNAAVVVVSPYGFGPFREKITLSEVLRRRQLFHTAPAAARTGQWVWQLTGKAQRWLRRRFLGPAGTVRMSRPLAGLLPVDWRRTRAVTLHGQMAALVYLNTPERFGHQVLHTQRQRDQAAADVLAAFREVRHPVTQQRLFEDVYLTAERFRCDPLERFWPEVVAIPAAGFQVRHRPDRNRHLVRCDPSLLATHRSEGMLMVRAPGVALGQPCSGNLVDVAPTILDLLDIKPAETMTGRALREILLSVQPALESRLPAAY